MARAGGEGGSRGGSGSTIEAGGLRAALLRSRRKTLSLQLKGDLELVVRAPVGTTDESACEFLAARKGWVERHRARLSALRAARPAARWEDGGSLPFMGVSLPLSVLRGASARARLEGLVVVACARDPGDPEEIRRAVERLYAREAAARFPALLDDCLARAKAYDIPRPALRLRAMRARWGSCDPRAKVVTLNTRLMRYRAEVVSYVIMHELAHLRRKGHDARFYALLGELCPEWRSLRPELAGAGAE